LKLTFRDYQLGSPSRAFSPEKSVSNHLTQLTQKTEEFGLIVTEACDVAKSRESIQTASANATSAFVTASKSKSKKTSVLPSSC
jgi:hypothetical protein